MLGWILVVACVLIALDLLVVKDPTKPFWDKNNFEINNWYGGIGIGILVVLAAYLWYQGSKNPIAIDDPLASVFIKEATGDRSTLLLVGVNPGQIEFSDKELTVMKAFLEKRTQKKEPTISDFKFEPTSVEYIVKGNSLPQGLSGPMPTFYTLTSIVKGTATYNSAATPGSTTATTKEMRVATRRNYTSDELVAELSSRNLIEGGIGLGDEDLLAANTSAFGKRRK